MPFNNNSHKKTVVYRIIPKSASKSCREELQRKVDVHPKDIVHPVVVGNDTSNDFFRDNFPPETNLEENEVVSSEHEVSEVAASPVSHVAPASAKAKNPPTKKTRKWTDEQSVELIKAYKQCPCLWDIKDAQYTNKVIRLRAVADIHRDLTARYVLNNVPVDEMKTRWNALRSQYTVELRRVQLKRRTGTGREDITDTEDEEIELSNMKFFSNLHFLRKTVIIRPSKDNSQENKFFDGLICDDERQDEMAMRARKANSSAGPPIKRKRKADSDLSNLLQQATATMQSLKENRAPPPPPAPSPAPTTSNPTDHFSLFGTYVASHLRNLPKEHATLKEEAIMRVIFG